MTDYPVPAYEEKARLRRENEALKRRVAALETHATLGDASIKAALLAWFDPYHPNQCDFAARMRKAIDSAIAAQDGLQGESS
jgi:hypothetical protein